MMWLFLTLAIGLEATATLSLRMVSHGKRTWLAPMVVCYLLAFASIYLALQAGMTIGVAYGIWTAAGVVLTAIAGKVLFDEPLTGLMGLGIVAIVAGVLLVEIGTQSA